MEISPQLTLGPVHLTVADLARSLGYYREQIGLDVLARENGRVSLGAGGRELLVLVEEPGARPADGYSGLFHFALLVPERADLARWLAHAARDRVALTGASDHAVSEALYLRDPDRSHRFASSTVSGGQAESRRLPAFSRRGSGSRLRQRRESIRDLGQGRTPNSRPSLDSSAGQPRG